MMEVWPQVSEDFEIPAPWSCLGPAQSPLLLHGLQFPTGPFLSAFTLNFSVMQICQMHFLIKLVLKNKHLHLVCILFTVRRGCQVVSHLGMDAGFYLSISFILMCFNSINGWQVRINIPTCWFSSEGYSRLKSNVCSCLGIWFNKIRGKM